MKAAELVDYTLRFNACIWFALTAFVVLAVYEFPCGSACMPIAVCGFMSCLCAANHYSWSRRSKWLVRLHANLLASVCLRLSRYKVLTVAFKMVSLTALLLSSYLLIASFGLLSAFSAQVVGRFDIAEEIYRKIPGYKRFCVEDRPLAVLWRTKSAQVDQLVLATKRVYGDESREVGYLYRDCAHAPNAIFDQAKQQTYLKQALKRFRSAGLVTDSIECMVGLAEGVHDDPEKLKAYTQLYPLVFQHPTLSSCSDLERMARYLGRPKNEIDAVTKLYRALIEYDDPGKIIANYVFILLLFGPPLIAAALVFLYKVSLPVLSWGQMNRLGNAKSDEIKFEILNDLILLELLRGNLDGANRHSSELFAMVFEVKQ